MTPIVNSNLAIYCGERHLPPESTVNTCDVSRELFLHSHPDRKILINLETHVV